MAVTIRLAPMCHSRHHSSWWQTIRGVIPYLLQLDSVVIEGNLWICKYAINTASHAFQAFRTFKSQSVPSPGKYNPVSTLFHPLIQLTSTHLWCPCGPRVWTVLAAGTTLASSFIKQSGRRNFSDSSGRRPRKELLRGGWNGTKPKPIAAPTLTWVVCLGAVARC